jgi:zinc transport system ATP-binding protein
VTSIALRGVTVTLGRYQVLTRVDATFPSGRQTVVIGPNGSGKSTLVQTILGQWPHGGTIVFDPPGPRLGYVPQRLDHDRHMPITVREFLALSLTRRPLWLGLGQKVDRLAREGLEVTKAAHLADKPLGALSGGELQRVMLAAALLAKPDVLILDEPATGVDINGEQLLCELLEEIKSDLTIVMVSHDLPTAKAHADWVVCLNRQVVAEGPPKEIFRPAILAATFGLHQALEAAGPEAAAGAAGAAPEAPAALAEAAAEAASGIPLAAAEPPATPSAAPPAEAPRPAGPAAASDL